MSSDSPAYTGKHLDVVGGDLSKMIDATGGQMRLNDDRYYRAAPMEQWVTMLAKADEIAYTYVPEVRDCDDYAKYLAGFISMKYAVNGLGIVMDDPAEHSYNVVLVLQDDGSVVFEVVEPQLTGVTDPGPFVTPGTKADPKSGLHYYWGIPPLGSEVFSLW